MQLTEDEQTALERYRELMAKMRGDGSDGSITGIIGRCSREELYEQGSIGVTLANMVIDRLFPVRTYGDMVIRWDDEIAPERLVACGFKPETRRYGEVLVIGVLDDPMYTEIAYRPATGCWFVEAVKMGCKDVPWFFRIRNMGDVWTLMERCGIEEGGK